MTDEKNPDEKAAGGTADAIDSIHRDDDTASAPDVADAKAEVADDVANEADETAVDGDPARVRSTRSSVLPSGTWMVAGLLAVVGLVLGVVGGIIGVRAYLDGGTVRVRDAVLATAETAAMNVTTIDPKNPDKFKQNVESVLTGRALQELKGKGFQEVLERKDAPGRLEGRVRRSAATEVNRGDKAGKALVYVDVVAKAPGQPDVPQTMGFLISVREIDGKYMADAITAFNPISYADQQRANQGGAQPNPNQQRPGGN